MPRSIAYFLLCFTLLPAFVSAAETNIAGLKVPPGFEITEFADSSLANDIYCLTVDSQGRVIVSGKGFIRLLLDDKSTGRATKALDFKGAPKDGAMGLFWEGNTLYCMGNGGLRRYVDASGAGREREPELLVPLKTGGEHESHAICRGPDGWLYVLCGNSSGIKPSNATLATSPVRQPIAGCVLRYSPDFKGCEIVADGLRNAYGMDFNGDGQLFTFDSDNERCVSLPWYEPTRLYHVVAGAHFGWQNPQRAQTWRYPPSFVDVNAPIATFGRGSPTGVVCYRHLQFPEHYRGGLFLLDWTFGRIYFAQLEKKGASYQAKGELFLEALGEEGFAPTAAAVDPRNGDLYVSIGGRGTRGAVYRIRYPKGLSSATALDASRLQPTARKLDWSVELAKKMLAQSPSKDLGERREALEYLRRHRLRLEPSAVEQAIMASWNVEDRTLTQAVARLVADLDDARQKSLAEAAKSTRERLCLHLAQTRTDETSLLWLARTVADKSQAAALRLDAVRLLERGLGDIMSPKAMGTAYEGYTRRRTDVAIPAAVVSTVLESFPSNDPILDYELARILALVECSAPDAIRKVSEKMTDGSDPIDDIHYLIVFSRLTAPRPAKITEQIASTLLALDRKLVTLKRSRDRNWSMRLSEILIELSRRDKELNRTLLAHKEFGRADHVLFTQTPGFDRRRAAEIFLQRSEHDVEFVWTAAMIGLLDTLPDDQTRGLLRKLWGENGLNEAILPLLARNPTDGDRERFVEGLNSPQSAIIRKSLEVLEKLTDKSDKDELLKLILALRRLPTGKEGEPLRRRFVLYLQKLTGAKVGDTDGWVAWYVKQYPEQAKKLGDLDGVDVAAWTKRLTEVKWETGTVERGKAIFQKTGCAACHSGTQALGPDLHGVGNRFSRADLMTAIIQPSKDVSPRYRTMLIATAEGKVYQGLIVYEAVDSLILQTGPATTIRLTDKQISERRQTALSLMPAGLLDKLAKEEIADLYAYLKSH